MTEADPLTELPRFERRMFGRIVERVIATDTTENKKLPAYGPRGSALLAVAWGWMIAMFGSTALGFFCLVIRFHAGATVCLVVTVLLGCIGLERVCAGAHAGRR